MLEPLKSPHRSAEAPAPESEACIEVDDLHLTIRRSAQRRTMQITVERTGELIVSAPPDVGIDRLRDFVSQKRFWIYTKLAEKDQLQRQVPRKEFVAGEAFLYLGRSHRLKLVDEQDLPLKLVNGRFALRRDAQADAREHFIRWYSERARVWLSGRVADFQSWMEVAPAGVFAEFFDVSDLPNQLQAIATTSQEERDEHGHWVWRMRPQLLDALEELGWVRRRTSTLLALAAERDIASDPQCRDVPFTTRQALVDARVGQGAYRARMLSLWSGRCAVTGCDIPVALIASHAKPWVECSNAERLDEYNGLLLAAQVDRLFDAGLISFADDGRLLAKSELSDVQLALVGLSRNDSRLRAVHKQGLPYMRAHRKLHGFDALICEGECEGS